MSGKIFHPMLFVCKRHPIVQHWTLGSRTAGMIQVWAVCLPGCYNHENSIITQKWLPIKLLLDISNKRCGPETTSPLLQVFSRLMLCPDSVIGTHHILSVGYAGGLNLESKKLRFDLQNIIYKDPDLCDRRCGVQTMRDIVPEVNIKLIPNQRKRERYIVKSKEHAHGNIEYGN